MRFLSFSQPWLWAILDPVANKRVENRSWMPPIEMVGQRFALHAAKSWDGDAVGFFLRLGLTEFPARRDRYVSSAILGVATLDRLVTSPRTLADDQRRWFFGPVGWLLADVRPLATPVPMKGAQGLRHLAPEVEAAVLAQIGAA